MCSRAGLSAPSSQSLLTCAGVGLVIDALGTLAMMPFMAALLASRSGHTPGAFASRAPSMRRAPVHCWFVIKHKLLIAVGASPDAMIVHTCWRHTGIPPSFGVRKLRSMPCSFGRRMGGVRRDNGGCRFMCSVAFSPPLAVHLLLQAAAPVFGWSTLGAFHTLILSSGVGELSDMLRSSRFRVGLVLCVSARQLFSDLGIFVAPHKHLLGQGPRSVGEPFGEPRQFHVPGGPPQIVAYAVLILRGNGVGIKNYVLDVGP